MNHLTDIIARLSRMMGQEEEAAREQFNLTTLTLTQMHYMETISELGNPSITELAANLNLSKPTVKVAVDKLIERNYVLKVQSDDDRRSAHIHLTEKGKLINQMHDYAHKRIAEFISSRLTGEEKECLARMLGKVLY